MASNAEMFPFDDVIMIKEQISVIWIQMKKIIKQKSIKKCRF